MTELSRLAINRWDAPIAQDIQGRAAQVLEGGGVVLLPDLRFEVRPEEEPLLRGAVLARSKNISVDPKTREVRGAEAPPADLQHLQALMSRFVDCSSSLMQRLLPQYAAQAQPGRASFRPAEIAGRKTSWRKDDTRLHVDSFPSSPTRGDRILRLFCNINPDGQPRTWRLGEPFEAMACRYLSQLPAPAWGSQALLHWLHVTKRPRSAYDHYMLGLHDAMKADIAYQSTVSQFVHKFESGSTWLVFTDQASHAAMRGQFALEQTFLVPVDAMLYPPQAPLRVLERLLERPLI